MVKACLSSFSANQIYMVSSGIILRRQGWFAVVLGLSVLSEAHAAFGGLVPLAYSGQVAYNYNYIESAGSQSESTSLLFGLNAAGYVWRPWFATTSLALNVGLSSTESTSGSTEGTVGTGNFSLGVFPQSRFPFSISYTRTDSRSQQFQDISQISGNSSFRVTRLTLRQSYRPRAYNQLYNGWYGSTKYNGDSFGSSNVVYGLDYQLRVPQQTLTVSMTHSGSRSRGMAGGSDVDVVSLGHVYTPSAELGVNSLASYVEVNPARRSIRSINSQAASSFFWRPEYRAVRVSGGVRLSENKSEGVSTAVSRSFSTNLSLGYQLSRSLSMNAGVSLGASDSGNTQTLSTSQTVSLSYSGGHRQWKGYSYSWQWNMGVSNATTETETEVEETIEEVIEETGDTLSDSTDRQNISSGIGHNLGKSWALSSASSLATTFSQSASGSVNSAADSAATQGLNHGASLSWSSRGGRGTTYVSARLNDSRGFGDTNTVFNSFGLNYNTNITINRLSSMTGSANYQVTQSESTDVVGVEASSGSRSLSGSVSYRNNRPFGIYNLIFTSNLQGGKQIASVTPTSTLRWEGTFRYNLGLLSTSLSFRASENAGGNITKSMNFQATRSF